MPPVDGNACLARLKPPNLLAGGFEQLIGDSKAAPSLAKYTVNIELIGTTEGVVTAKGEVLESWTQGEAGRGPALPLRVHHIRPNWPQRLDNLIGESSGPENGENVSACTNCEIELIKEREPMM